MTARRKVCSGGRVGLGASGCHAGEGWLWGSRACVSRGVCGPHLTMVTHNETDENGLYRSVWKFWSFKGLDTMDNTVVTASCRVRKQLFLPEVRATLSYLYLVL